MLVIYCFIYNILIIRLLLYVKIRLPCLLVSGSPTSPCHPRPWPGGLVSCCSLLELTLTSGPLTASGLLPLPTRETAAICQLLRSARLQTGQQLLGLSRSSIINMFDYVYPVLCNLLICDFLAPASQ